ncbi:NAD-dependent DNA ligase LigA, partial [Pirellulales bacterium]|nr:NAD-dependent DNA ligase LigA [Pirellulales bacterium]
QETSSTGTLLELRICFTGTPRSCQQKEIENLARQNGAAVTGNVSSKTDFLVRLESPGSKVAKAEKLGVKIVDEDYFYSLLSQQ